MNDPHIVDGDTQSDQDRTDHHHNLMCHIERIDLLLQQHYYRQAEGYHRSDFLLSEEEIAVRLNQPLGAPAWATPRPRQSRSIDESGLPEREDALTQLIERFDLTDFESNVLLLGLLPHFDRRYRGLFSSLQGDAQQSLPTFELALALFNDPASATKLQQVRLLPHAPLLGYRLLETQDSDAADMESWGQKSFITATEVFHHLLGGRYFSPELQNCVESLPARGEREEGFEAFLSTLQDQLISPQKDIRPLVMLRGREGSGRARAVAQVAQAAGREALSMDMSRLPEDDVEAEQVFVQFFRYARMSAACVVLRSLSILAESRKTLLGSLSRQLEQPGLAVVCLVDPLDPLVWLRNMPQFFLDMPTRSTAAKSLLLDDLLAPLDTSDIDSTALSRCFHFTPETLPSIIREATFYSRQRDRNDGLDRQDLRKAMRLRSQQNFGKLAQRVEPARNLDDLIVSDELRQQLREITAAIKHREAVLHAGFHDKVGYGTGISALFCGPSGTGKTMAAEVLAASQGVDLIKVDLSTVVNKYIGETEKNLSRIFDLAEADAGVLFFDEADALFGKRSETKDAKDRHANIEVSYLLQRLESYPGLVVLATNSRGHLDDAFSRRFTFITRFSFPDAALRERMWRAIWPKGVRLSEDVDLASLATRADVTGANIRNIALLSTWLAADETGGVVHAVHIECALKRELAKVGRLML
ncbi:ATP-dependent zinc metalloprotease FtsH [Paraburkholderia domus]|jgi:ATPases of the AAA+ class|uniref:ATP-binding protein n=1 Tax=Paraburkholderia domus TaxID=2793075 RepID=UPI001911D992|nr:AAA family ATPase [Paraburkholderia domus]MCI0147325.1 AAA family ATPase [Paraburkholderia sediminicola]CAE6748989.1 ATP-dependent zinc metalloprotease FtsH [Paraburkholderia domus]CAE6827015.1 ATP-dependent zinc metalloprotease FtsH [Paraburkholderia domus]CAE6843947.1 ATP-dependent zinc metalloprotease FtsH [Paraburkholderia domus]CAE6851214.1 ATP-dependent zinc metalloprotease FtsH [Paraburkholderia domus]